MEPAALELVQQLLAGPVAAMELYARQWCTSPEDVVQEALVKLASQRPLPDRPIAWMYQVIRRGAISAARSASRRRRHETLAAQRTAWFEPTPSDALDAQLATQAMASLPLKSRELLVARLWGNLSFQEIGELVGCSSSAAHRRYGAALDELRERLGVACPNVTLPKN